MKDSKTVGTFPLPYLVSRLDIRHLPDNLREPLVYYLASNRTGHYSEIFTANS